MSKYDDIINLPHHESKTHPKMPRPDRAAQFSPFAALTGFDSIIKEKEAVGDKRIMLDEEAKAELDRKLSMFLKDGNSPAVTITYYCNDEDAEKGRYLSITGRIREIAEERIILDTGHQIMIEDILDIE